jgi:hypothetical protein
MAVRSTISRRLAKGGRGIHEYTAGSEGPSAADDLIQRDDRSRFKGDVVWCLINDRGSAQGVGG